MKKILAVAACALLAGCLEPQEVKEEKASLVPPPKNETVFDDDLEWVSVKSVRILSTSDKRDEIDRINISTSQDIDRALKEGALHWITDSIFATPRGSTNIRAASTYWNSYLRINRRIYRIKPPMRKPVPQGRVFFYAGFKPTVIGIDYRRG